MKTPATSEEMTSGAFSPPGHDASSITIKKEINPSPPGGSYLPKDILVDIERVGQDFWLAHYICLFKISDDNLAWLRQAQRVYTSELQRLEKEYITRSPWELGWPSADQLKHYPTTKRNFASHAAGFMYGRYAYLDKICDFLVQDEDVDDITAEATRRIEGDRLTRLGLGDRP